MGKGSPMRQRARRQRGARGRAGAQGRAGTRRARIQRENIRRGTRRARERIAAGLT